MTPTNIDDENNSFDSHKNYSDKVPCLWCEWMCVSSDHDWSFGNKSERTILGSCCQNERCYEKHEGLGPQYLASLHAR
jgi:hypothetical protein